MCNVRRARRNGAGKGRGWAGPARGRMDLPDRPDRPGSPTISNLDTLYAMTQSDIKEQPPPPQQQQQQPSASKQESLQVNVPSLPGGIGATGEHQPDYLGVGNAPQNFAERNRGEGDGAASRRSSLDISPSRRSSLGRDRSESFSSRIAAEEQEARVKVEQLRAQQHQILMADDDDERDGLTKEQEEHKLDGGNMADMFFGGSPGMVIHDSPSFPPSPYPGDAQQMFADGPDGPSQEQIDAMQAVNRTRTMTPAGPVPRPSADAQRLTLMSQGGARRASGGDQGASRWQTSPPQQQWSSPDKAAGGGASASLSGMLSTSSPQKQQQQQQQQQQSGQAYTHQQAPMPQRSSPTNSYIHPQALLQQAALDEDDDLDTSTGSASMATGNSAAHRRAVPNYGAHRQLEQQLERRDQELHSLRIQLSGMAKALQTNTGGGQPPQMAGPGGSPARSFQGTPQRGGSVQQQRYPPAAGGLSSTVSHHSIAASQHQQAWAAHQQYPRGSNHSSPARPGSMQAAAEAAILGSGGGVNEKQARAARRRDRMAAAEQTDGMPPGYDDRRPISTAEAAQIVADGVDELRRSVRWFMVNLNKAGGRRRSDDYTAEMQGLAPTGGAGAELQGKARQVCWVALFLMAGVLRLLLLLLWAEERTPDGGGGEAWRVVLLLHAVLVSSICWQYSTGIGLLSSGMELRTWEGSVAAAITTHGEMQSFELALAKGRRYALCGILLGVGVFGTLAWTIWGGSSAPVPAGAEPQVLLVWAWPLDEDTAMGRVVATVHSGLVYLFIAPLALLPRLPLAYAHATLLRRRRASLAHGFLLDTQGFGGASRAHVPGKSLEAAHHYRTLCGEVVSLNNALDSSGALTVSLALDLMGSGLALYLLLMETLGGMWHVVCGLLLARWLAQWPLLLVPCASLSRYEELQNALLASSVPPIELAPTMGPGGGPNAGGRTNGVEELALLQLVAQQQPSITLCGGWLKLGGALLALGPMLALVLVVVALLFR